MAIADLQGSVDIGKAKKMKWMQTWVQERDVKKPLASLGS